MLGFLASLARVGQTNGGGKEPLSSISNFLHSALCVFSLSASKYNASDRTVHCLLIVLELVWPLT